MDKKTKSIPVCCPKVNYARNEKNDTAKGTSMVSKLDISRSENPEKHFDLLSVVSEECMSNTSEGQQNGLGEEKTNEENEDADRYATELPSEIYTEFQTNVPPLEHFENISYNDTGPSIGNICNKIKTKNKTKIN